MPPRKASTTSKSTGKNRKGLKPSKRGALAPMAKGKGAPSVKPKPKQSPKTRARRTGPVVRVARRSNEPKNSTKLMGQAATSKKQGCASPQVISYDGDVDDLYLRMVAVIDEFIFRAVVTKSALFTAQQGVPPLVPINQLRGYWLYCFQYYMWKCGCLSQNFSQTFQLELAKIPLGLAKMFQQFAPYVDSLTGTTFRWIVSPLNSAINPNFFSVDSNTAGVCIDNLNAPLNRYMIHPSSVKSDGTTPTAEWATLSTTAITTYAAGSSPFTTVLNSMSADLIATINSIYPATVELKDIPEYAPDASSYTYVTSSCVSCPCPIFRADISLICGNLVGSVPPDLFVNYPYDKPLPVCRVIDASGLETTAGSVASQQTITQVFAYMTSLSRKWVDGSAIGLLKSTQCFTDIRNFTYRSYAIDIAKVSRKIAAVFRTSIWDAAEFFNTAIYNNAMFSFVQLAWSAVLERTFASGSTACTGDKASNTSFFVSSSKVVSAMLPPVIAKTVSLIGPVKINGQVYFPHLGTTRLPFNTPEAQTIGWTTAVATSGTWAVGSTTYGLGTSSAGSIPLTTPGGAAFSRTDPVGVRYGVNMGIAQSQFIDSFINQYPKTFICDSWPTIADEECGSLKTSLIQTNSIIAGATTVAWQNIPNTVTINGVEAISSASAGFCCTPEDALYAAAYGVISSDGTPNAPRPLRIIFNSTYSDPGVQLQTSVNQSGDSQSRSFMSALMKTKRMGNGSKVVKEDTGFVVSSKELAQNLANFTSGLVDRGSGDRQDFLQSVKDLAVGTLKEGIKRGTRALLEKYVPMGGQNDAGKSSFINMIAPVYHSPPALTYVKNDRRWADIAEEEDGW